jgi:hypothetical protein
MRYLTSQFAIGALRRGNSIEQFAEHLTDARPDRWVNDAVAGAEYIAYVRSRRNPAQATSPG